MKLNNKGFAITTLLYGTLVLFLMLFMSMLGMLASYKDRLGKLIDSSNGARDIINGNYTEVDSSSGEMVAYAVYSAYDNSLRFYKTTDTITAGATYNGRIVTAVYTGFEEATYSSATEVPWWNDYYSTITTVAVEDSIKPISTQNWFYMLTACTSMDLTNLDTSNVTSMVQMFYRAGGETFEIVGLDNWDVSKVTNMNGMFYRSAYSATTFDIGDISGWDTSSVTDMSMMFYQAGYSATYTLNLRSWNVSNVTSYTNFNYQVTDKITAPTWAS